ncbi:hypothetical protein [Angustibacter sp. Root456]|uniref:hypothetical protein n=1 Tax=Angustibacter sp. Root456 TaxID=1736539 RepID=UPI0006FAAAA9|nr:hypothetical protein [Angustibacter sp. Root456]KQX68583.1 hypothetical protein ASD06_17810 [Angustibacter sp. Root456]
MDGAVISVDLTSLDALRGSLREAAHGIQALREHPDVVRARAADTGDPGLAAAALDVATAWAWGLELLSGELRRWDALLGVAASAYLDSDRSVLAALR